MSKNIIVTGSSGFIGGHLVSRLKAMGHHVHGIDILPPRYEAPTDFYEIDLRRESPVEYLFSQIGRPDEVYNLACLMGGMGFIGDPKHNYDIMVGSSKIITNVLECSRQSKVRKSFFSSSACVYNMDKQKRPFASLKEEDAYPAMPDLVYGWQKLFGEQMYEASRAAGLDVRIARFHNIFGPYGAYDGGKEKAPAAICRKVAEAQDGGVVDIWGSGRQTRSFLYIDECIEGVLRLMESQFYTPINIGSDEEVTINQLARMIIEISGKMLQINNVPGPEGVAGRNSDNSYIRYVLGWAPHKSLYEGLLKTYNWISQQISQQNLINK
jgi:GDP-D-mannose 3',5'-epimerase